MFGRKPEVPGQVLWEMYIAPFCLHKGCFADQIGITKKQLEAILAGEEAITPEIAAKLEKNLGPSAQYWLKMQNRYGKWKKKNEVL